MEPGEMFPRDFPEVSNAVVLSCKGSATEVSVRFGDGPVRDLKGPFEIITVDGVFFDDGSFHLHTALANDNGETIGGHLKGFEVYTTMEWVLGELNVRLIRREDERTGYRELMEVR